MIKLMGVLMALGWLGSSSLVAAENKVIMQGWAEGGFSRSWQNGAAIENENQFLVDNLSWKITFPVSDKTSVFLHNAFALTGGNTAAIAVAGSGVTPIAGQGTSTYGAGFNTSAYYSAATSHIGRFYFTNLAGYIQHKCSENVTTWFGHFRMPFGMETLTERFSMPTYYFTDTFNTAHAYGWEYDLGAKMAISNLGPGTLEFAVADGRFTDRYYPASALRYMFENKVGTGSITPVASVFTGRWGSGPGDVGFSAGAASKFGKLAANVEFLYASQNLTFATDARTKAWSFYLEPTYTVDGIGDLSMKAEYSSQTVATAPAVTDINLGLGVTHSYGDGLRVRATYAHRGLKGDRTNHINDFRILVGTQW